MVFVVEVCAHPTRSARRMHEQGTGLRGRTLPFSSTNSRVTSSLSRALRVTSPEIQPFSLSMNQHCTASSARQLYLDTRRQPR